jgi:hypothetical protein
VTPRTRFIAVGAASVLALSAGPIAVAASSAPRHRSVSTVSDVAHRHHHPRREASLAGDGPRIVTADDFTTDHRGLKPGQIEMTTVDARPTLIAGHRARIAIRGLAKDDHLQVVVDGQRLRHTFHHVKSRPGQATGAVEGVVTHLPRGLSVVVATAHDEKYGRRSVHMQLDVHSLQGPVITGPHQEPFVCQTTDMGLGAATDDNCRVKTRFHWWYKDNTQGDFHRLRHPYSPYPDDVATTTRRGKTVPFVLRVQNIVINRAVTRLAVLDDPHGRGKHHPFKPVSWNHNLAWHFGESCGTGFHQGDDGGEISVFSPLNKISSENIAGPFLNLPGLLAKGYMVGESSLTIFGVHCNQVLSAETLMMVKELVTTRYGDVHHVIGGGASGGAIQQYTIANGYPGILDAGTPLLSFPDVVSTAMTVGDCVLLKHFYDRHSGWTANQRTDVTGLATTQVCNDWDADFGDNLKPTSCPGGVDPATVYNATTNPTGVRCDLQDDLVNILGTNRATGAALRPLDNVGVQYGLVALRRGQITPAQFIALNRKVGGVSLDGEFVKRREAMTTYEAHRIFDDSLVGEYGAINQTPIIDQTIPVSDDTPQLDIHDQIRAYEIRARLNANYGGHQSQAIWSGAALPSSAIVVANHWLTALDALQSKHPWRSRAWLVAHSRPAAAADACRLGGAQLPVTCAAGKHSGPRQKAGGPLTEDVLKCRLRTVRRSDYPAAVTTADFSRIRKIFSGGVCAYGKHSVGYAKRSRVWLSYGDNTLYREPVVVPYPLVRSRVPRPGRASRG